MIVIVMGVVGAGKTTVGRLLADALGWQFADADDFHSTANKDKIRHGIALTDTDREPWLDNLRRFLLDTARREESVVLACSALKHVYRERLRIGLDVNFVYLRGTAGLIASRLRARQGHFADEQILASQFADLEEPGLAIVADIAKSPDEIVQDIRRSLHLS